MESVGHHWRNGTQSNLEVGIRYSSTRSADLFEVESSVFLLPWAVGMKDVSYVLCN